MRAFASTFDPPAAWIAEQLQRIAAGGGRRAAVLVPAERHAHAIRRHVCLQRGRPQDLAGVLFLRPVDLARELLVRAGQFQPAGGESVRRLRLRQLFVSGALEARLRYFRAPQLCNGYGYADAFARAIADLDAAGLDPEQACAVADRLAAEDALAGDRLHDVALAWRLADSGAPRTTTAQMLRAATRLVTDQPAVLRPFGSLLAVLVASPVTALVRFFTALPLAAAVFQDARPWRRGAHRWRALLGVPVPRPRAGSNTELGFLQRFLFEVPEVLTDPRRPRSSGADGTLVLEEYASLEDEVEAAACWVTEQIAAGVPLEEIALVVPETDPYAALLLDRLGRVAGTTANGGIRAHVAGGVVLATAPAGMLVWALLRALVRGLEAEATIPILPLLRPPAGEDGGAGTRLSLSRAADIVYGAGIVGGRPGNPAGIGEWTRHLSRRRDALRARLCPAAEASGSTAQEEIPLPHDSADRQHARRWLQEMESLLPAIAALQALAQAVCNGVSLPALWPQLRAFCDRWVRLPPEPPGLLALLDAAVQPLLTDPVAPAVRGAAAVRAIEDALRRERQPLARYGEACVFIGTPAQAAGVSFGAVRVLGLVEGGLPQTAHDDPIIPDALRTRIEAIAQAQWPDAGVVLPRMADRVLDDLHDVFRVVSGATARVALSAPRQWVDRSDRAVSGILLETALALGRSGGRHRGDEGDVPTAARLRAHYLSPGRASYHDTSRRLPLSPRALLAAVEQGSGGTFMVPAGWLANAALAVDGMGAAAVAVAGATVGAAHMPGLSAERPISASGLVRLLQCPYRFLLERVLRWKQPAQRPSTEVIEPGAYGALFHVVAERCLRAHGAAICRQQGTVETWIARARAIAVEEFERVRAASPLRGGDSVARERGRLLQQVEALIRHEWQLAPREFLATELRFGEPTAVRVPVGGGDLYLWGAVDRVDQIGPQALSIRDLKTGRVHALGEEPINAERDLQLGVYMLALEQAGYAGGARATRAAYVHPCAAEESDRVFSGANLELLRQRTQTWLTVARQLLDAQLFPRTPDERDCRACPFRPLCGDDAARHSAATLDQRSPTDPLAGFVRLRREEADRDDG